jgi:multimeric flavodoxin WrbA
LFSLLLVDASPFRGSCYNICLKLDAHFKQKDFEVTRLKVYDMNISECLGCYSEDPLKCTYPCVLQDDMEKVYHALLNSDAAVFVTPTYWSNVPGKLKNLVDRLTSLENNGYMLEGLVAAVIAVQEVSGGLETASWLASTLNQMGAMIPPYAIQVFYQQQTNDALMKSVGSQRFAKEFWGEHDLEVLAENIFQLCKLEMKRLNFGFKQRENG